MSKKLAADTLFVVQFVCTLIFGGSQFLRMFNTSQGVSVTWFVFWEGFLGLNLVLAIRAHRVQPSRVTFQTVISYAAWTTMVSADLAVMLWKISGTWDFNDTLTTLLGGAGVLATLLIATRYKLGVTILWSRDGSLFSARPFRS